MLLGGKLERKEWAMHLRRGWFAFGCPQDRKSKGNTKLDGDDAEMQSSATGRDGETIPHEKWGTLQPGGRERERKRKREHEKKEKRKKGKWIRPRAANICPKQLGNRQSMVPAKTQKSVM